MNQDIINEMVRDFTQVTLRTKSEVRRRIESLVTEVAAQARGEERERIKEKLSWLTRYWRCIFMPVQNPQEGEGMFDMLKEKEVLEIVN